MGDMNLLSDDLICRHWAKGYCKFAKSCNWAHSQQQVQQTTASSAASATAIDELSSSAAASQASPSSSAAASAILTPSSSSTAASSSSATAAIKVPKHGKGWPREEARAWAHIFLFVASVGFELVPALIGHGGCNTRYIYLETKAKVRIRGEGSGHLEVLNAQGQPVKEAPVPLQIAITTEKSCTRQFRRAVDMTISLLKETQNKYRAWCKACKAPSHIADAPMFAFGEVCRGTESLLMDLLKTFPDPEGHQANQKKKKKVTPGGVRPGLQMFDAAEPHDGSGHFQLRATAEPFNYNLDKGPGHTGTVAEVAQTHQRDLSWLTWVDQSQWQDASWTWPTISQKSQTQWQESLAAGESQAQWYSWQDKPGTWPTESVEDSEAMNQDMMDIDEGDKAKMDDKAEMDNKANMDDQANMDDKAMMDDKEINTYQQDVQNAVINFFNVDDDM
jgi:hypothetical protein